MELKIILQVWKELEESKEVVERLIDENLKNKLSHYLNKFDKTDAEWIIDLSVDKNTRWLFDGKLQANFDWKSYRSEREDFKKLDDLINHMFLHIKESLSKEK